MTPGVLLSASGSGKFNSLQFQATFPALHSASSSVKT